MRYTNRLSVAAVAIAGGVAALLLLFAGGSSDATVTLPEPSIPPDCSVVDEPTENGPAAPSNLTAEWSPAFFGGGFLLDAFDVVSWIDNSADETCFVVEMRPAGGSYEFVAILSANAEGYSPISGPGTRKYRVYAAHADGRSTYSNEGTVNAVYDPPTPTLSPSPTSTPSPPTATPTPMPSAMPDSQPTPAGLPNTGGLPD